MRLFVAVDLSPETRAQLSAVREQIDSLLNGRRAPRITWVKPEVAHLTVQFLGDVADDDVDRVIGALGGHSLADGPFVVSWDALGAFPDTRRPRVLWLGAASGTESMQALAREARKRLAAVAIVDEDRPFRAHVTVARVRDPGSGVRWSDIVSNVRPGRTRMPVDHVTLYHSQLSPHGPRYTALATWTL
jgi:RNA 2',3'-cyclic 3'-phosphodiesterase